MKNYLRETPEYKQWQWGRGVVYRWYMAKGAQVAYVPGVVGFRATDLPDMMVSWPDRPDQQKFAVVVKVKTEQVEYRKTQTMVHGYDLHMFEKYRAYEAESEVPVLLTVVQRKPPLILTRWNNYHDSQIFRPEDLTKAAMIFFPVGTFEQHRWPTNEAEWHK